MLTDRIHHIRVERGNVAVFWLGQAGFLFKTADGTIVMIDPYLSDCCERYFGFKRLMPHMLRPDEIQPDILIATHAHYDHFDPDSVPALLTSGAKLIAAKDCAAECERLGISTQSVRFIGAGDTVTERDVTVTAKPCDHGEQIPDAIALLLEVDGKRIYIAGDTSFRPDYLSAPDLQNPDLAILPINGAFGNMDEEQAARAAAVMKPELTIPCHFWNFAEHGGNPGLFAEHMKELAPDILYNILPMGGYTSI